jgi:metal-responsive CopG/Arc/MetJ family transcriptional regulator
MARKQVIVQLDDELIAGLDTLADQLGINRSELVRRGAKMVLDQAQTFIWEEEHRHGYLRVPEDLSWQDGYASMAAEGSVPYRRSDETG